MGSPVALLNLDLLNQSKELDQKWLDENGKLRLLSHEVFRAVPHELLRSWMWRHAQYGLPTKELIDYLKELIDVENTIEIGAGNGWFGSLLGVKMTDSRIQERQHVAKLYASWSQPVIKYPVEVEKLSALEAIEKYKPHTVLGMWVTQKGKDRWSTPCGIDEEKVLKRVERYIMIGNLNTHNKKRIFKQCHLALDTPFLMSRGINPTLNRMWTWSK